MRSFIKFGVIMALLFVFVLPSVFPMSRGDGNPSIKSSNENLVAEDILNGENGGAVAGENDRTLLDNSLTYKAVDNWVTVQDIETTVNEQKPHTAFNPIVFEEFSKTTSANDKWAAIYGADEDKTRGIKNDEKNRALYNSEQNSLCVFEKSNGLVYGFDEDDIRTLPTYPTKGDKEIVVNI